MSDPRWFWLGIALAWAPTALLFSVLIGPINAFRGISEQRAIVAGAVAGEMARLILTVGVLLLCSSTAIVLLIRSLSWSHWVRAGFSLLSIGFSVLVLMLGGMGLWAFVATLQRAGMSR